MYNKDPHARHSDISARYIVISILIEWWHIQKKIHLSHLSLLCRCCRISRLHLASAYYCLQVYLSVIVFNIRKEQFEEDENILSIWSYTAVAPGTVGTVPTVPLVLAGTANCTTISIEKNNFEMKKGYSLLMSL